MSRFANAIGIWEIDIDGKEVIELKPAMKDIKTFRNILSNDKNRKNKTLLFDSFSDFMYDLISTKNPEIDSADIREWVELYINPLFESAMIAFKWTTLEELEKDKQEAMSTLKKEMSSV